MLWENFAMKKSGEISPSAKFSRRVTNNFTANSDAHEICEFRYVQRCTRQREGTEMCLFACSGCVTGMHWTAVLPRILKVPAMNPERPSRAHQQTTASFLDSWMWRNHLEERLLDQAQARASYTPLFWGHSRSIPQGMIFDVQPLVKSLFCLIRPSPNGFFDSEASIP